MSILDDTNLDDEKPDMKVLSFDDDDIETGEGEPVTDDSDEGEEVFEDDEVVEEKPKKKIAVKKKRRSTRTTRRTRESEDDETGSAQSRLRNRMDADLDEFYSGMDFGTDSFSVSIERLEPKVDDEGEDIAGHLQTFRESMTKEDLKKRFGGGLYKVTIRGPNPSTGRGSVIRGSKQVRIAGRPKISGSSSSAKPEIDAMNLLLQAKEEDMKRVAAEAKETKDLLMGILTKEDKTLPLMMQMMQKQEESMNPMMVQMMKQQEAAERRREEERKDQIRREELAETRRLEQLKIDEERRRQERIEDQRRFEMQMENQRARAAAEMQANQQSMQMMMQFFAQSSSKESNQQGLLFKLMTESNQQALAQSQNMMQFQGNMFQAALAESKESQKQKSGFGEAVENLAMLKEVMGFLGGGGQEDNRSQAEKIIDKVVEVVPSLGAVAAEYVGAKSAGDQQAQMAAMHQQQQQQQLMQHHAQQQQITGPMQPGTVVALDEVTEIPVDEIDASTTDPEIVEVVGDASPQPQQQQQQEIDPSKIHNDFKAVMLPKESADLNEQMMYFIKDVDFAIDNGWGSDRILNDIMIKFPKEMIELLTSQTGDELIDFIDKNVPPHWVVTTPKGEEVLRASWQKLVDWRNINSSAFEG